MKGYVLLKNTEETKVMLDKCLLVVKSVTLDDMKKSNNVYHKWSWEKCWFVKECKQLPIVNFLYRHRNSVIEFINDIRNCIEMNGDIGLSLISYNELVKLSKGNIDINTYWLLHY